MSIQLTRKQEERIQAFVRTGAYSSTEDVVDAALAAVELAAPHGFEGTQEELDELLLEGFRSGGPLEVNEAYWDRFRSETERIATERQSRPPRP